LHQHVQANLPIVLAMLNAVTVVVSMAVATAIVSMVVEIMIFIAKVQINDMLVL